MKAAAGKKRAPKGTRATPALPSVPQDIAAGIGRILRPQAAYRWLLPSLAAITPNYVESVLRAAMAGDHVRQWELFDLMFDTWPELASCAQELTYAVAKRQPVFEPWREENEPATETAVERCALVSGAMRRMRPDATADENGLDQTIVDLCDVWFRGVGVLEIDWHQVRAGKLGMITGPRCTSWVHPVSFGWSTEGRLGLRTVAMTTGMRGMPYQATPGPLSPFPPNKFLVGIHKAKCGTALGGALLRPLAWWWCAANFSSDWLLNLAQLFGLPFRWANYEPNAPQATVDAICNMLQNMGSAGWAAFPAGTTLELKDTGKTGDQSPQGELLDRADRYARLLVLGQTMSGGSGTTGKGGGQAFGTVEADVKQARVDACSRYVEAVINLQLAPAILDLNYGDADECPQMCLIEENEGDLSAAQRDQILAAMMPVSGGFLRKKYNMPAPEDGEETVGGKSAAPETTAPADPADADPDAEPGDKEDAEPAEPGEEDKDGEKELLAKLRVILAEKDEAVFAKNLTTFAAAL